QVIIGYRLTSFTIKSRRNVDFRSVGTYVPDFKDVNGNVLPNNKKLQKMYKKNAEVLFTKYGELVDEGIPVEDCRYMLPYTINGNIIMGCDANELLNMTSDMLYGEISKISEVRELGEKLANMIRKYVPYLARALDQEKDKSYYGDKLSFLDDLVPNIEFPQQAHLLDKVEMTDYTHNADWKVLVSALMARYQYTYEQAEEVLHQLGDLQPTIKRDIMQGIINSKSQRELEQAIFSFQMPISLAVLTHITRHRMHSLLVPGFTSINFENIIVPDTIKAGHEDEYRELFANNMLMMEEFKRQGVRPEDLICFLQCGHAVNITTTMNARCLEWISRMRCCNKAQLEPRRLANQMVELASNVAPLIGEGLGPTCKVFGYCNEGKDSCKNRGVVIK
ncbi:MAG: FAD-dependent thymidylate synthase, partial [Bacilli bacterium]|nr:FAD-dependent thymidylate synthase [Bacilli bacterium]